MVRFFATLCLLFLPVAAQAVVEYQLDVQLLPSKQQLLATAIIATDDSLSPHIELHLSEQCEPIAVHQNGETLDFTFVNGLLEIDLHDHSPISVSYRGSFVDPISSTPKHHEDPSYGVSAVISTDGTFLSAAADWYPRLNTEDIHYRLSVASPAGVEVVTSGRRIQRQSNAENNVSVWDIDYPLSGLTISAGNYQVFEDHAGAIPIYAYFYPSTADQASVYLQQARKYLELYVNLFGDYPFHKFAIVENFFPTGYGFPSWTLLGSSVIRLPFIVKTSLGHEMAHSWWGTGVKVDYRKGNWAEGLTTYVADYLYEEQSSAEEALEYRLKILRDYAGLVRDENAFPLDKFLSRNDKSSQAIGYGKAAMLFHMLRKQVGEQKFWSVLQQIATEKRFQSVAWSDFAKYFSSAAGYDLSPFFTQWLTRKTGPQLVLSDVRYEKADNAYLVQGKIIQTAPAYQLAIDLLVETENQAVYAQVQTDSLSQPFRLETDAPPHRVIADPEADLFRVLAKEEIPPAVNTIRGSDDLLVLVAEKDVPSQQAITNLLSALRKSDLPINKLSAVSAEELVGHDLLVFGYDESLKPKELSDSGANLFADKSGIDGKSLFIVRANPLSGGKSAAWFLSNDSVHDAVVARKIPHYGKYSFLQFESETNLEKRTFPPESSPLTIDFDR